MWLQHNLTDRLDKPPVVILADILIYYQKGLQEVKFQ